MCFKYGDVVSYKINNTKIWVCHKRLFFGGYYVWNPQDRSRSGVVLGILLMALIQPLLSLEAEGSEVLKMVLEVVFSG